MNSTPVEIDSENRWHSQHDRDAGREPCPDRIVEDLGSAFGMGCIGGFIWNFCKGYRNSPKGERFIGAMFSARSRAPILGGNFAVWGGTFSTFDCTLQYIRRTDDWVNNVSAGFLTGGVLALRGGVRQAGKNAVMGGIILAVIEGVSALLMRSTSRTPADMHREQLAMEEQQRSWEQAQKAQAAMGGNDMNTGMFGSMKSGFSNAFSGIGASVQPATAGASSSAEAESFSTIGMGGTDMGITMGGTQTAADSTFDYMSSGNTNSGGSSGNSSSEKWNSDAASDGGGGGGGNSKSGWGW